MKRAMVVATAVLVLGATWAASAATTGGRTPISCMDTLWHGTAASTSSKGWSVVPGFKDRPSSIFPVSVNVAALLSGAPALFRVIATNAGEQTDVGKPGVTRFDPGGDAPQAFSYQWIEPNQSAAEHAVFIRLQWRSPTGKTVKLLRGDMSLLYATDGCKNP